MSNEDAAELLVDRVAVIKCHHCQAQIDVARAVPFAVVKCPECGHDLPVPAILGNFVLFKVVGKGAMGAVYQGFDQTLKRHVAIKLILGSLGEDKVFVDNFMREARALAALNHVNVVQIYSCGTEKGQPYIVMELIVGERFDELILESGVVDERRLLDIAKGVAKGLRAANAIGLVHGDIKPQNILMDQQGTPKVVDFGLARSSEAEPTDAEIWGTPYYIAPEKARRQREDHRSDIYCLGATLFHALAGFPPFDGETARDVVLKRLREKAPDIQQIRPELHDETAHLIARMLEAEPIRRYPTYDSLMADIDAAILAAERGPRQLAPPPKRIPLLVKLFLIVLLVGGAIYGFVLRPQPEPEPEPEPPQGRTVMRVVNGKLQPVFIPEQKKLGSISVPTSVPVSTSMPQTVTASEEAEEVVDEGGGERTVAFTRVPPAGYVELIITADEGGGADATIFANNKRENFGLQPELLVGKEGSTLNGKVYLKFDLRPINLYKCSQPFLILTATRDWELNTSYPAKVQLYGLTTTRDWDEGEGGNVTRLSGPITWNNAPGNLDKHTFEMSATGATQLMVRTFKDPVRAGESLYFPVFEGQTAAVDDGLTSLSGSVVSAEAVAATSDEQQRFLEFLQGDEDKVVSLVLTLDNGNMRPPLFFASRQNTNYPSAKISFFLKP